jgi:hypothetical protein
LEFFIAQGIEAVAFGEARIEPKLLVDSLTLVVAPKRFK